MTKTTKKTTDFNSIVNQEIKSKFVQREVKTCFSYEMDEILKLKPELWDDMENLYRDICTHCGHEGETTSEGDCPKCNHKMENEPQEIFEYWIVSDFLYRKLKEQGEPVLEWGNNCYWGRCTTGQAILLDYVISKICSDMEILDGQKYSWKE